MCQISDKQTRSHKTKTQTRASNTDRSGFKPAANYYYYKNQIKTDNKNKPENFKRSHKTKTQTRASNSEPSDLKPTAITIAPRRYDSCSFHTHLCIQERSMMRPLTCPNCHKALSDKVDVIHFFTRHIPTNNISKAQSARQKFSAKVHFQYLRVPFNGTKVPRNVLGSRYRNTFFYSPHTHEQHI